MRTFIIKHNTTGEFVIVKEGELGFYSASINSQEHADSLNEANGHTPGQVKAAEACSMFGWNNFNELSEKL
jgi:hypothetical protein